MALARLVRSGECDLGITHLPTPIHRLRAHRLGQQELLLIFSPSHGKSWDSPTTPDAVARFDEVGRSSEDRFRHPFQHGESVKIDAGVSVELERFVCRRTRSEGTCRRCYARTVSPLSAGPLNG